MQIPTEFINLLREKFHQTVNDAVLADSSLESQVKSFMDAAIVEATIEFGGKKTMRKKDAN